jgi:alginate O-acetyltransferase complex protein AlgI
MQFNSYSYLLLLVPAVLLFWALPAWLRRWYVLALSIAYYATWSAPVLAVPLALCAGVQLAATMMLRGPRLLLRWFRRGVIWVLGIFLLFRYHEYIQAALARAGLSPVAALFTVAVPLGISFYSFECISYLIDAKQGRIKQSRFSDLYLFIMFWPHLMAGPIVRYRELAPQFAFDRKFELAMLLRGLDRLLWGLALKNVLANSLGGWVDEGFLKNAVQANSTIDNWTLAAAFGLQVYFDFAAYSNMAIGVAQLIGVTLPENFRFPYHAATPPDFWSRWHMTLSRWIRDYLFFPVNSRFRGAPGPLYISLIAVMALVGLWHGIGWGFVLWGTLHGVYLVAYRIWDTAREKRSPGAPASKTAAWGWRVATLVAVTAAWIPFRAETAGNAAHMLASMFVRFKFGVSYALNFYVVTLLCALFCVVEPFLCAAWHRAEAALVSRPAALSAVTYLLRPAIYAVALLFFVMFDDWGSQFIYFQF